MIEKYVPPDHQNNNFFERLMERRIRELKNPSTTEKHDRFPCPMKPLRYSSSKGQRNRLSTHSSDSGNISPLALSRLPALSPATPIEISTSHPSTSQPVQKPQSHLEDLSARSNNSLAVVPNCVQKSQNKTAHSRMTPILSHFGEPAHDRAINFDPFYHCHIF